MKFTECIRLNKYYLQNRYRKFFTINIMLIFSFILIFTITIVCSSLRNMISHHLLTEFLCIPKYISDSDKEYKSAEYLLDESKISMLNTALPDVEISRMDALTTINIYNDRTKKSHELTYHFFENDLNKSTLPIVTIDQSTSSKYNLYENDQLRINNQYFTIIHVEESDTHAEILLPQIFMPKQNAKENILSIKLMDSHLSKIKRKNILETINLMVASPLLHYELSEVDIKPIYQMLLDMVEKFLMLIGIVVFIISLCTIFIIVHLSSIERKEEFIILQTFGLIKRDMQHILQIEIGYLFILSLSIGLFISIIISYIFMLPLKFSFFIDYQQILFIILSILTVGFIAIFIAAQNIDKHTIEDI